MSKRWIVYDNGSEAGRIDHPDYHESWPMRARFESFHEAEKYAIRWLGIYGEEDMAFEIGVPFEYSGFGDTIEIREEEG